jgi:hypothetical protein
VSATPHVTDVEVSRALNALVVTLNDWKVPSASLEELQRIVTGALGGEERIVVRPGKDAGPSAQLAGRDGKELGRLFRQGDRWVGERTGAPLSGGYIPR